LFSIIFSKSSSSPQRKDSINSLSVIHYTYIYGKEVGFVSKKYKFPNILSQKAALLNQFFTE
ncbi:MAG: hypothetical protein WA240_09550, partial [Nitrospirota bacterium]